MIVPVVMAGGAGTRLWPLSRRLFPKQFLPLVGDRPMLLATLERLAGLAVGPAVLVCNEDHRFIAAEQARVWGGAVESILLEPVARNTAPAVALAALHAQAATGADPLLLVLAADHVIADVAAFHTAVAAAADQAERGRLVTFGITPAGAETGYGYIRRGALLSREEAVYEVAAFVEKPDADTARAYLETGDYYWNSGIFVFRASRFLAELGCYRPEILAACERAAASRTRDGDFVRVDAAAFAACPADSIDYAVMEHTDAAAVVELHSPWNDVGSWAALWELADKDADGNACRGDVLRIDSSNNLLRSEHRLLATVGLRDTVVVETKDAVLVAPRERIGGLKQLVAQLAAAARPEEETHRQVYRPWGSYDTLDAGHRFQVKRILVEPGASLSTQMHHHRAEHWIVVAGTARVALDGKETLLAENESIYIPIGTRHSLANPGKLPLELIEVQTGAYLGEDDIVRFEDRYGRA
ncbi:MAG: mannose-1-phosphate guanylyltransferase/mannose-6-phosphate isomerase [Gammaproteobacteria bacterium]|nr:mannose-1-phosphate guanylyltransferase/mannose-6-phosphate isomerase [Gammaproteobacteria bacterium]